MQTKRNRCTMATTQVMPHRNTFGCATGRANSTQSHPRQATYVPASTGRHGFPLASPLLGCRYGDACDRSPWMKEHVDQLMHLLAEHHISIPRRLVRAELADYLTTFSFLFRASRFDARRHVTTDMLRASAREIAAAHAALPHTGHPK